MFYAALFYRERTGQGALVDITVFEPILHALGPALSAYRAGDPPPAHDGGAMMMALRGTFRTADDRWVAISASTPRHERAAAELVGAQDMAGLRATAGLVDSEPAPAHRGVGRVGEGPGAGLHGQLPGRPFGRSPDNRPGQPGSSGRRHRARSRSRIDTTPVPGPSPRGASQSPVPQPGWGEPAEIGSANRELLGGTLGLSDDDVAANLRRQGVVG